MAATRVARTVQRGTPMPGRVDRVLALAAIAGAACACVAIPRGALELARAERLLGSARESGAREEPLAAADYDRAEAELARARSALGVRDGEGAASAACRAAVDAEVARMRAIEASVRRAAQRTEQDGEELFRELVGADVPHAP